MIQVVLVVHKGAGTKVRTLKAEGRATFWWTA